MNVQIAPNTFRTESSLHPVNKEIEFMFEQVHFWSLKIEMFQFIAPIR